MIDEKTIFVAFDTETTGLSPADNRVVEIAAVRFSMDGDELDRFAELVNPGRPIPEDAYRVHHISDQMVVGQSGVEVILPRFIEYLSGDNVALLAQNAIFDIGFVNHEAHRCQICLPRHPIIDQIDLTRTVFPNLPGYSLESTCRLFKLVDNQNHRALADAILVKKLFRHCLEQLPSRDEALSLLNNLNHYGFGGPMVVRLDEEKLAVINRALEYGEALEIVYAGGSMRGRPRPILPTIMFNRDGVAYLTARCLISNLDKHFRLDRIKECRIIRRPPG